MVTYSGQKERPCKVLKKCKLTKFNYGHILRTEGDTLEKILLSEQQLHMKKGKEDHMGEGHRRLDVLAD